MFNSGTTPFRQFKWNCGGPQKEGRSPPVKGYERLVMVPQLKVVTWHAESDAWGGNDVVWCRKKMKVMAMMMVVAEEDSIVWC